MQYSQPYGDTQYPHGELGPMRGQVPVDPAGAPARYPFMPYYGSKGPDSAQFAAAMSHQRPPYGGDFSSMPTPEAMYGQGWGNSMMPGHGYMGPHGGKPGSYMQVSNIDFFFVMYPVDSLLHVRAALLSRNFIKSSFLNLRVLEGFRVCTIKVMTHKGLSLLCSYDPVALLDYGTEMECLY